MLKKLSHIYILFFALVLCVGLPCIVSASESTSNGRVAYNEETGYEIYIDDWAQLLTPSEEDDLRKEMESITAYGNVAFVSIDDNPAYSATDYAKDYGYSHFGDSSYTLVIIDMDYREICVYSNGELYKTITTSYAKTITDNIYTYASNSQFYDCAHLAFEQINTLLDGRPIAQPMKYISNALLSIVLALLINYFIVMGVSRSSKASDAQLLNGIYTKVDVKNPTTEFLRQTKRYSPQASNSSGSRSSGGRIGGGGFSGGGGSRGGGGSHRF